MHISIYILSKKKGLRKSSFLKNIKFHSFLQIYEIKQKKDADNCDNDRFDRIFIYDSMIPKGLITEYLESVECDDCNYKLPSANTWVVFRR